MKFYIWGFLRKSVAKIQVSLKSDKSKGYFTWRPKYIFIISRSFLLRTRNVSDKIVENIKTHILFWVTFFFRKSCRLWENVEKYCRAGQATDDNMANAHCILGTKGYVYTHSGCVILIAFPLQRWLHERATVLRSTYIACLVNFIISYVKGAIMAVVRTTLKA
jgi:hypothetical protein